MAPRRIRIGVIGCGLIAQVMHLPFLCELDEQFELAALCDLSPTVVDACARRFGVARTTTRWSTLLDEGGLDAVLVATPGSHAPAAIAAAQRGLHVFVEKPMCVNVAEGEAMVAAARAADVRLMVGTMKRYDPAYQRLADELERIADLRLVRVTTLESPLRPYVAHYPLAHAGDVDPGLLTELAAEDAVRVDTALGAGGDPQLRTAFRDTLLDCLIHELNMLRGLLGEPDELVFADVSPRRAAIVLRFGAIDCHLTWVDLPGIARYSQEVACYGPDARATLRLPSPFLRSAPPELILEGGVADTPRAWQTVETTAYEDAFKLELRAFHAAIVNGSEPPTDGLDGLRDVALCTAIAQATASGARVPRPSATALDDGAPPAPAPTTEGPSR